MISEIFIKTFIKIINYDFQKNISQKYITPEEYCQKG